MERLVIDLYELDHKIKFALIFQLIHSWYELKIQSFRISTTFTICQILPLHRKKKDGAHMLTASLITLVTLLERLLASGTLTMALSALFKKVLIMLGAY
jgi:CRP-like cAMP-binding protein